MSLLFRRLAFTYCGNLAESLVGRNHGVSLSSGHKVISRLKQNYIGSVRHKSFLRKAVSPASSSSGGNVESKSGTNNEDWQIIYRFRHITGARAIQRIKVYQTVFSVVLVTPVSAGLYYNELMELSSLQFVLGGSTVACIMLYVMGNIFGKLVGLLYTSPSRPEKVKIARLTFWGGRQDQICDADDFVPIAETNENPHDIYFSLKRCSKQDSGLYLSLALGLISDISEMERIFGRLPDEFRKPTPSAPSSTAEGEK